MRTWFYVRDNAQFGPVGEEELANMIRQGQLDPAVLVWTEGLLNWTKAAEVESLVPTSSRPPPLDSTPACFPTPAHSPGGNEEIWSKPDLLVIAKHQKYFQWLVPASMAALFIPFAPIVTGIAGIILVYRLSAALGSSVPLLYALGAFLPLVGIIIMLHLMGKSTKLLRAHGIRVGLMGARMSDFDQLP